MIGQSNQLKLTKNPQPIQEVKSSGSEPKEEAEKAPSQPEGKGNPPNHSNPLIKLLHLQKIRCNARAFGTEGWKARIDET